MTALLPLALLAATASAALNATPLLLAAVALAVRAVEALATKLTFSSSRLTPPIQQQAEPRRGVSAAPEAAPGSQAPPAEEQIATIYERSGRLVLRRRRACRHSQRRRGMSEPKWTPEWHARWRERADAPLEMQKAYQQGKREAKAAYARVRSNEAPLQPGQVRVKGWDRLCERLKEILEEPQP